MHTKVNDATLLQNSICIQHDGSNCLGRMTLLLPHVGLYI